MQRLTSTLLALVFFGLSAAGCPGCPPAEGEGEDEDLVSAEAAELCAIYLRGQTLFVQLNFGGGFQRCSASDPPPALSDEDIAAIAEGCRTKENPTAVDFELALTGGRVLMNLDNIRACSEFELEGQTEPPAACENLFTSLQDAGDACQQTWDCSGELVCQAVDITSQQLTCTTPADSGEACLPQIDLIAAPARTCAEGLECVNFTCVPEEVVTPPAVGDDCADDSDCGGCLLYTSRCV